MRGSNRETEWTGTSTSRTQNSGTPSSVTAVIVPDPGPHVHGTPVVPAALAGHWSPPGPGPAVAGVAPGRPWGPAPRRRGARGGGPANTGPAPSRGQARGKHI